MTATLPSAGKWVEGLHPDTPCVVAARRVLKRRLRSVEALLPLASDHAHEDPEYVHQLRVATRRSAAALRLFESYCPPRELRRLRRGLRRIRRAAAAARLCDVQKTAVEDLRAQGALDDAVATALLQDIDAHRLRAQDALRDAAERWMPRALRARRQALLSSLSPYPRRSDDDGQKDGAKGRVFVLRELAIEHLPKLVRDVRETPVSAPAALDQLHRLRLKVKRLRYAVEIFSACGGDLLRDELYPVVQEAQDRLGRINDAYELLLRLESVPQGAGGSVTALHDRLVREREDGAAEFHSWWSSPEAQAALDRLETLASGFNVAPRAGTYLRRRPRPDRAEPKDAAHRHWRVAAVDVGTNSLRLVVAESDPVSKFRVIEDVRETTRLGAGLYTTGRLNESVMEASLSVLEQMRTVWDGLHVDRIRAVATSAVREARNGAEFVERVRRRVGLQLEVIDAEYEARLAFSSVTNAFPLEDRRFAVVDLGGGSAELILSNGGLIDGICKLPLGAVRLTEMYGLPGDDGAYRFNAMRKAVEDILKERVSAPTRGLDVLIGSGGTFTTLAKLSIRRGMETHPEGRFSFALRGYELGRGEVAYLLDWLRSLSLAERRQAPGMGYRRAEIIVAGLCVVERLMEHLGVERLWIHDGGIRDGLLAEMIDDLTGTVERSPESVRDVLSEIRAYAERQRYDFAHSEHVTHLALRIFDQLAAQLPEAAGSWAGPQGREILQAAGILHDVGILIGYARHHRHSYEMILHADLPGLSRRESALIAAVARYHRRGGPKQSHNSFRRLRPDDQRLVAHLAGILRIADGLDRSHTQTVRDVRVECEPHAVTFHAETAGACEENLRAASKKANVFEEWFRARARIVKAERTPRGTKRQAKDERG